MANISGQLDIFGKMATGNEDYDSFVDKFIPKKTTDDCYTPGLVYDAVADWVAEEYGRDRASFVRPFWPNADYTRAEYPEGCTVVDNPPFSLMAQITRFFRSMDIPFFIFGPTLTLLQRNDAALCYLPIGVTITYENGAEVNTSFITNMEAPNLIVRSAPSLYRRVKEANDRVLKQTKKQMPKYIYPDNVLTLGNIYRYSKLGIEYRLDRRDTMGISALDAQKAQGKGIFGKGLLLSERAAAERAAAERAAAERAVAERAAAIKWPISEREKEMIRHLGQWRNLD